MPRPAHRSSPFPLLHLGLAFASVAARCAPVFAVCPGSGPPHTIGEVNGSPQLLQVCRTMGGQPGCDVPAVPTVANAGTQAQEMSLQATVPAGFTATTVRWEANSYDPTTGAQQIWQQPTTDAENPKPGSGFYYVVRGRAKTCLLGTWGSSLADSTLHGCP